MADLSSKCQAILDKATHADNGPAGLVFGAVDRTGKVLVEIACVGFADASLTRQLRQALDQGRKRHDDRRLGLLALVNDQVRLLDTRPQSEAAG